MKEGANTIRIGDKFQSGAFILEVIGTKPGGRVELMERARCRFVDMWHRDVSQLERLPALAKAGATS